VQSGYLEDNWGDPFSCQLRVAFCMGGCEDGTSAREDESPMLEAAARGRSMKKQQAGKGLAGAVVIRKVRTLSIAL
jgi:hypothetical protein